MFLNNTHVYSRFTFIFVNNINLMSYASNITYYKHYLLSSNYAEWLECKGVTNRFLFLFTLYKERKLQKF